jgi:citrate synthase
MTDIHRGLAGVNIDTSSICSIDGDRGELIYRGYDIRELADKASFEEVAYLLWNGDLPDRQQLAGFLAELREFQTLPAHGIQALREAGSQAAPMSALRTAVSMLGATDPAAEDLDVANQRRIGLRLLAQVPVLTAAFQRLRNGKDPVAPDPDLSLAANFLYMLSGEKPSDAEVRVMDVALVLHAEHGSNASTFVARATASTLTDIYSAITAAIGSLKGPLHGGANTAVMQTLEQLDTVEAVEPFVLQTLAKPGGRVMGFGHRVYRVTDPRARILKGVAEALTAEAGGSKWFDMSLEMERVMDREMQKKGKQVKPNVDFYSASVYRMLGFPGDMFTPVFTVARVPGWMAHLYEQYGNNSIMRPRLVYSGKRDRKFVPLAERG